MGINRDAAEMLAVRALGWIAAQEDLLVVFMGATGAGQEDLRARAADPEFLASVLDFLVMDDAWVTGFCNAESVDYSLPMQARAVLPGGEAVNWT